MTREHLSPARGPVRTGLGAIALAAALAVATSACQSSSSKASVVGQDPTASTASTAGAPGTSTSSGASAPHSAATPAKASGGGGSTASAPASNAGGGFKVGQQVKVGDFTVTVHKVTYPYSNDLDQPDSGKAYVLLDVEVGNATAESQAFSSLMQLGLKDSTGTTYDETIMLGVNGNPPDGDIAAGKSIRGPVGFEVPAGAKGLRFSFLPDLGGDKTYIDLGK